MKQPSGCLQDKPNKQTVKLGGKYINLSAISRMQGIDQSYLSRIFSGKRYLSIPHARKIAASIGMGLEEFLGAIDERNAELKAAANRVQETHNRRLLNNALEDAQAISLGQVPTPRLPI